MVEDEEFVRHFVQTVLESNGYKTLLAANGRDALRVWKRRSQDVSLLLTDMIMPGGLTGKELAQKLSADKPGLKVIFTSGYALDLLGDNANPLSGYSILQKPYRAQVLASIVRQCLDGQTISSGIVATDSVAA